MKKMINVLAALSCAASLTFMTAGCQSSKVDHASLPEAKDSKKPELKNINAEKSAALMKTAEKYIDDILIGMKDNDYKMFSKNLTPELKGNLTLEKFKLMGKKFKEDKGTYVSKKYIGELNKGYFKVFLWKGQFKKLETKKKGEDKNLQNDTLVRLILGHVDDKYLIFGFSFQ